MRKDEREERRRMRITKQKGEMERGIRRKREKNRIRRRRSKASK